jgi:PAS domain S-box-containing protein
MTTQAPAHDPARNDMPGRVAMPHEASLSTAGLFASDARPVFVERPSSGETRRFEAMGVALGVVVAAAIFIIDVFTPQGVATSVWYMLLVLLSLWSPHPSRVYAASLAGTLLTVAGAWISPPGSSVATVLANRGASLIAIWATALVCLRLKRSAAEQARMSAESRQVEEYSAAMQRALAEKEAAQKALHEREVITQAIVEQAGEGIVIIDGQGIIEWMNPAAAVLFGCRSREAPGREFARFVLPPDDDARNESLARMLNTGEGSAIGGGGEGRGRRLDGTAFPMHYSVTRMDLGGRRRFTVFVRDLTETKKRQLDRAQAQKLESIGQLAAGIAHEINTPTQYVGDNNRFLRDAFADLQRVLDAHEVVRQAARRGDSLVEPLEALDSTRAEVDLPYITEEIPRSIEQSLDGVDRIAIIVRAMKGFSHPAAGERAPVDIHDAIESTITVARNEWKYVADVVTDFDPGITYVPCYPGDFNQVILNLLVNAAHAVGDAVKAGAMEKGTITISTRLRKAWVEIGVHDTGTGIPQAIRGRIFDPFFTTKEVGKGTGQGLSLVHAAVVDKHGGEVRFQTETGKGTTFFVRLPLVPELLVRGIAP